MAPLFFVPELFFAIMNYPVHNLIFNVDLDKKFKFKLVFYLTERMYGNLWGHDIF